MKTLLLPTHCCALFVPLAKFEATFLWLALAWHRGRSLTCEEDFAAGDGDPLLELPPDRGLGVPHELLVGAEQPRPPRLGLLPHGLARTRSVHGGVGVLQGLVDDRRVAFMHVE